jgi:hypothetical protein
MQLLCPCRKKRISRSQFGLKEEQSYFGTARRTNVSANIIEQIPHQALLLTNNEFFCGGSLLNFE